MLCLPIDGDDGNSLTKRAYSRAMVLSWMNSCERPRATILPGMVDSEVVVMRLPVTVLRYTFISVLNKDGSRDSRKYFLKPLFS